MAKVSLLDLIFIKLLLTRRVLVGRSRVPPLALVAGGVEHDRKKSATYPTAADPQKNGLTEENGAELTSSHDTHLSESTFLPVRVAQPPSEFIVNNLCDQPFVSHDIRANALTTRLHRVIHSSLESFVHPLLLHSTTYSFCPSQTLPHISCQSTEDLAHFVMLVEKMSLAIEFLFTRFEHFLIVSEERATILNLLSILLSFK